MDDENVENMVRDVLLETDHYLEEECGHDRQAEHDSRY